MYIKTPFGTTLVCTLSTTRLPQMASHSQVELIIIENLFGLQKKRVLVTAGRGSLRPHWALQPVVLQVHKMLVLIILSVSQPSRRAAAAVAALAVQENEEGCEGASAKASTKCHYSAHDDSSTNWLTDMSPQNR